MVVCRDCDALIQLIESGLATYRCPRCGCVLRRAGSGRPDSALALYIGAGIFFLMANVLPVLTIEAAGNLVNVTLTGAALALGKQALGIMSWVVLATTVVIPATELTSAIALLLLVKLHRAAPFMGVFLRLRESLRPWRG